MQYIEAPSNEKAKFKSVFLAGGITNCLDWQTYVANKLKDRDITVFNPRRKNFPILDTNAAREQIEWEHQRLRSADINAFWFPKETLCPIALFELGGALERNKPLVIGIDSNYLRKKDIEIQVSLQRPETKICYSLDDFVNEIERLTSLE
jgi:hypothetical protein